MKDNNTKHAGETAKSILDNMQARQVGAPKSSVDDEEMLKKCIAIITTEGKASVSLLQRRLKLGYKSAVSYMDELEKRKVVGPSKGAEPRDILVPLTEAESNGKPKDKPKAEKPKSTRPVQMEAPALVPKLDGVGKAGKRLAKAIRAVEDATEEKGKAEQEMITQLQKAERKSYQTMGFKFNLSHTGPKDKITVQKPK